MKPYWRPTDKPPSSLTNMQDKYCVEYSGMNIFTVLIRLGIIPVTVIIAVILIIIFTIYAVTVISSRDIEL